MASQGLLGQTIRGRFLGACVDRLGLQVIPSAIPKQRSAWRAAQSTCGMAWAPRAWTDRLGSTLQLCSYGRAGDLWQGIRHPCDAWTTLVGRIYRIECNPRTTQIPA